jgi:GH35 family endo-1,4-beta-xylanase
MSVQDVDTIEREILARADDNVDACRRAHAVIQFKTASGKPVAGAEVEIVQKSQDFLFGNLVFDMIWKDPPYEPERFKQRFLELFNLAIFPFYWSRYERTPGKPDWKRLVPALEWCLLNGITPKGHPLVWPYTAGVPLWLYDMPEDAVEPLIKARVIGTVRGFEDSIQIWDVTNEAVNHVSWREATDPAFKAKYHEISYWRELVRTAKNFKREIPIEEAADWVEHSLRWAYAGNPRATLIVNDYDQIAEKGIRQRYFALIEELQARGAPISGLGLQVHPIDLWLSPQEVWDTLEMYAGLGIPIHVTEIHQPCSERAIQGGWREGTWSEKAQTEYVAQLYRLFFGHPSVVSINYWGFSERTIWLKGGGLVDEEYRPKPVFDALKRLIKGEWTTPPISATTDAEGKVSFRGFHGTYRVSLKQPGKKHPAYRVHVARGEDNRWAFTLD